ncbi:hypothetical protein LXA43DRAFT_277475 [Ganoderma leucocontextum]|nr:hypothetical protein LXA43DRAFT_277475 [Ganoderma leucocontextum]
MSLPPECPQRLIPPRVPGRICPRYVTHRPKLAEPSFSHASLSLSVPPAGCAGQSGPGTGCAAAQPPSGWRRGRQPSGREPSVCCARRRIPKQRRWTEAGRSCEDRRGQRSTHYVRGHNGARQVLTQDRRRAARVLDGESAGGGSRRSGPLQDRRWVATASADVEQRRRAEHHIDAHPRPTPELTFLCRYPRGKSRCHHL